MKHSENASEIWKLSELYSDNCRQNKKVELVPNDRNLLTTLAKGTEIKT